jgi:hypothetical protein
VYFNDDIQNVEGYIMQIGREDFRRPIRSVQEVLTGFGRWLSWRISLNYEISPNVRR